MPNVKSAVKRLNEVKGTTSAGKSDVLLVMYTITPHQCFMKPRKEKKRKRRGSDDEEEEEEKKTKFLFFDFECMQETGVHVPNLVVVQDDEGPNGCLRGPTRARIFAIGCLETWIRLCVSPRNSKGMIRISF